MRQIDLELNMLFVNVFTDVYKYEFLALIWFGGKLNFSNI